ncbi:aminopeptidase N [Vibrio rumoiensis]|uniref:Aminopeptidase N n=1 Tax=Vibrio rumoiensis 1S-45 TaxID=1188252 RepID=A0A1E5E0T4_9VIBR|nr:aminopeptidase N [Vibrio rumoiensis]OEF24090.1 aminopeptidase N [Vibrio rumoiensis 1S-45]
MSQQPQAKYRKDYTSPEFTITNIDLTFDLFDEETKVTAVSTVVKQGASSTLILDGEHMDLISVHVDGNKWSQYEVTKTQLHIHELPDQFELTLVTNINPSANTALEGLYKSGGAFCTQCEAEGFRRITYFLDRPDVLAKYTTTVIADQRENPYLLSNGNRIDSGDLEGGRHWVKWSDPHPKPSYLFAVVAGQFDVLRDQYITKSGRKVDLEIFVDQGNLDRAPHAMTSLINAMKWDEGRFGLEYDLDIYMIVAVDFFNMGAMENKGLNVFNSKYVLANDQTATDTDYLGIEAVIGHEYFHNWTGNRITCRDWFQLSLKEGLTVFRDQEFSSDLGSRAVNRINNVRIIRGPQFAEDASPMSHPIRPDKVIEMNNFYTLTVYEKGSEVIRMIHTLLGEDSFQKGMKLYVERHDGTAATCDDFVAAMEDGSGVDLTQFRLWYSQSGTPLVKANTSYNADEKTFVLELEQVTEPTLDQPQKQALHIPMNVELYASNGAVIPLYIDGKSVDNVLDFKQSSQRFVFENVQEKPVPSLLREFSAPVKFEYDYSDSDLMFLMVKATNEFARWDAGQNLIAKYLRNNIEFYQSKQELVFPQSVLDAFKGILLSEKLEPAFIAEMLTLPSQNEVAGWFKPVDVDAISEVLGFMKKAIAAELVDELTAIYHSLNQDAYIVDHPSIGKRALRNVCLSYLATTDDGENLVKAQYQSANNMTDTMAAMNAANQAQLDCREVMMNSFSDKWSHDGLVMDKWFMLQGTNPAKDALTNIKQTMSHPAFSLKNPNRTRSLVGAFFNQNPVNFHAVDGSGYRFASEILVTLNESNPQVASRMIDPLLKYRQFDEVRQDLIRTELEKLSQLENLAKDLYEKITKALEA